MHDNSYQDVYVQNSNLTAQLTHVTAELHYSYLDMLQFFTGFFNITFF